MVKFLGLTLLLCLSGSVLVVEARSVKESDDDQLVFYGNNKTLSFEGLKPKPFIPFPSSNPNTFVVPLKNHFDTIYKGEVWVGTPKQKLDVVFDSGASATWFPIEGCKSEGNHTEACLGDHNLNKTYNPQLSQTVRAMGGGEYEMMRYGKTEHARGRDYRDVLEFGSSDNKLSLKEAQFSGITYIKEYDNGVIGLALSQRYYQTTIMNQLIEKNALKKQMFSMHLRRCGNDANCKNGGQIVFGDYDTQNCELPNKWLQIPQTSILWELNSSYVEVNNIHGNPQQFTYKLKTIVDSGNSYIHLPRWHFYKLLHAVDAKQHYPYWTVACDQKIQMKIRVEDVELALDEKTLVLAQGFEGQCVLAVSASKESSINSIVLGMPAFRSYCITHDIQERRIAFSKIKA